MKNFTLISSLFLILSCSKSTDIDCIPKKLSGLVIAFYPFSNGSLLDNSGNALSLSNPNGAIPTDDRLGNISCAYLFNGTLYQELNRNGNFANNFNNKPFSISLWYMPLGSQNGVEYEHLITRTSKPINDVLGDWNLALHDCRRARFFFDRHIVIDDFHPIYQDSSFSGNICTFEMLDLTGKWHHLVATYDGNTRRIYRNGKLSSRAQDPMKYGDKLNNKGDVIVGRNYEGKIDDIILFNKELTQEEVLQLYNLEPCCD